MFLSQQILTIIVSTSLFIIGLYQYFQYNEAQYLKREIIRGDKFIFPIIFLYLGCFGIFYVIIASFLKANIVFADGESGMGVYTNILLVLIFTVVPLFIMRAIIWGFDDILTDFDLKPPKVPTESNKQSEETHP